MSDEDDRQHRKTHTEEWGLTTVEVGDDRDATVDVST